MSFDKDDGTPIVNVHKRTTRVNIWMAIAVLAFILAGVLAAIIVGRGRA